MVVTDGPLAAAGPDSHLATLRAALDWWALAGVDTLVAALPRSWLDPAPHAKTPERPVGARPLTRPPAATAGPGAGGFDRFGNLAALHAHVGETSPGAPLFDGVPDTGILLVGEAPSATDLETGRPFTGPAGQLLDRMLAAIGLDRRGCGITLLAPRRPMPGPPGAEDIAADLPLTHAHLRLLAPRMILLLGATVTRVLAREPAPITAVRGQWRTVTVGDWSVPALPTFNPAYLLRRPEDKALAWADLLAFRARLDGRVAA